MFYSCRFDSQSLTLYTHLIPPARSGCVTGYLGDLPLQPGGAAVDDGIGLFEAGWQAGHCLPCVGWLAGWLDGWLAGWLVGWLAD